MSLAHLREMAFGLWHSKSSIRPSHTYRPVHTPYTTTHPHLLFVTLHSNHGFNILPRLGTHGKIVSMCDTYSCVHIFMATRFAVRETYLFRLYVEVVPDGSFAAFCTQNIIVLFIMLLDDDGNRDIPCELTCSACLSLWNPRFPNYFSVRQERNAHPDGWA